jgi:hypothetical protein
MHTIHKRIKSFSITPTWDALKHGLINHIDTKKKCRHLKYLSCGLSALYLPRYSHRDGGGGGGGVLNYNQREGERGNRSQSWVENTNMTECTQEIGYLRSIISDKHLPQSRYTDQFFR